MKDQTNSCKSSFFSLSPPHFLSGSYINSVNMKPQTAVETRMVSFHPLRMFQRFLLT